MINECANMIDNTYEIINDMGTAPVVGAMIEVLKIPQAINSVIGNSDSRKIVDTGTAIKALIINILYGRDPLVHVEETFKRLDCEVLFGEGLKASDFNDDCLGKSLEVVGNLDIRKLYSVICMNAMELHSVIVEEIHVDTTNISVYGEYNNSQAKDFEITYGEPKSKRKDLKQLNIGLYVQQNGFPIGGNALSGNKSDVIWFREALEEISDTFAGDINTMPICIFDAAGSNTEMFKKANNNSVPTIIRLSDSFNVTEEHIVKAWNEGEWEKVINKNNETIEKETAKDFYKLKTYQTHFDGFEWRLLVVYSSELERLKESTAKRNYPKQKEKLDNLSKKLLNTEFETYEQAKTAGDIFIKKNISERTPFKYEIRVEEKVIEKYAKRGKPSKKSEKTVTVKYIVKVTIGERDEELYKEWLKKESCFVIVSNVPLERCNNQEIFREYKEQWVVEEKFRFLKQPVVLGSLWLQSKVRIKGLIFVLLLAVLVNMYICYRCAISLTDSSSNKSNVTDKTNYKGTILTTDGRPTDKPTYKTIKRLLTPLKTIIKLDKSGEKVKKFVYGTEGRMLDLVVKIGFNPKIYLEKFSSYMDLWHYNRV
jgi:transposase